MSKNSVSMPVVAGMAGVAVLGVAYALSRRAPRALAPAPTPRDLHESEDEEPPRSTPVPTPRSLSMHQSGFVPRGQMSDPVEVDREPLGQVSDPLEVDVERHSQERAPFDVDLEPRARVSDPLEVDLDLDGVFRAPAEDAAPVGEAPPALTVQADARVPLPVSSDDAEPPDADALGEIWLSRATQSERSLTESDLELENLPDSTQRSDIDLEIDEEDFFPELPARGR